MAACAQVVQQPDGRLALVLDPVATDLSTCPYVVQSGAELSNSLFSLTAEDGAQLSGGIVACWVAAWCLKAIIQVIKGSSE
jgi:hypothetical protein